MSQNPETIRALSKVQEEQLRNERKKHLAAINAINGEINRIQAQCPHEAMGYASYSKWCNDCGKVWDTT